MLYVSEAVPHTTIVNANEEPYDTKLFKAAADHLQRIPLKVGEPVLVRVPSGIMNSDYVIHVKLPSGFDATQLGKRQQAVFQG